MPERIITDGRGQRWDVIQQRDSDAVVFRHQSGQELRGDVDRSIDAMSTDDLLDALDRVRRDEGLREVGHEELDVAFDAEGYETGRDAGRPRDAAGERDAAGRRDDPRRDPDRSG